VVGGPGDARTLPTDPALIRQLLLLGRGDEQDALVDAGWQRANVVVRTTASSTGEIRALASAIEARLAKLPPHLHGRVTGQAIAFQRVSDRLIAAQLQSLVLALGVAYVILSLLFLSPRGSARGRAEPRGGRVLLRLPRRREPAASLATSVVPPIALASRRTRPSTTSRASLGRRAGSPTRRPPPAARARGRPARDDPALALCLAFAALATAGPRRICAGWARPRQRRRSGPARAFALRRAVRRARRGHALGHPLALTSASAAALDPAVAGPLHRAVSDIVAQHGTLRNVPAGQPLLLSGDEGREMFLVIDGSARGSSTPRPVPRSWAASGAATCGRGRLLRAALGAARRSSARLLHHRAGPRPVGSAVAAHRGGPVPQPVADPRRRVPIPLALIR
jgi:hypothetical protein